MKRLKRLSKTPTTESLFKWNIWLAVVHAAQAVIVLVLATTKTFSLSVSYLTVDSLQSTTAGSVVLAPAKQPVWDLNLAYLVAAFFLLSALAHTLMATVYRSRYEADLGRGINRLRWFEYALSASVMLVGIAVLAGMYDVVSLVLVFGFSMVMNLLGLVMELTNSANRRGETKWSSYVVGCVAGLLPWLAIATYLWAANVYGSGTIPTFVYWIFGSLFVFFSCFAVNMYLQYRKIGPWKNYVYGERMYMILSLTAKSLLAWQVFAGALRP